MDKHYTVAQVATILKVHPKTIQRYIREGKLPAVKVGRAWRITENDWQQFLAELNPQASALVPEQPVQTTASSVIDLQINQFAESERIVNLLFAAMKGKADGERSSVHLQAVPAEKKLRLTLWGDLAFIQTMLALVATVLENLNDEDRGGK